MAGNIFKIIMLLPIIAVASCVTTGGGPDGTASMVVDRIKGTCGATVSLERGDRWGTDAYVVSVYPEPERAQMLNDYPTEAQVRAFIDKNADVLKNPANSVGAYCERATGDCHLGDGALTCYLDISREVPALADAARLARACNQKAIAHLRKDRVDIVDSEGGKPFGNGKGLEGKALESCKKERG